MRAFVAVIGCLVAAAGLQVATALNITPSTGVLNDTRWEGDQNRNPEVLAAIGPLIGGTTLQYKEDDDSGEENLILKDSYSTTFTPDGDANSAVIQHTAGAPVAGPQVYLLVKDSVQKPAWYLFDLTALGWNGTDSVELAGFWPDQGAISYVALYVPDGGSTAVLLGLALLGMGYFRRRRG